MTTDTPFPQTVPPTRTLTISARQRKCLHELLHRNLRKCSSSALASLERIGWAAGAAGSYELTEKGRRVAETCELFSGNRPLEIPA
jgi:hypothetical protein